MMVFLEGEDKPWLKARWALESTTAGADLLDRLAKAEELLTRSKGINVTNGPVWRNERDAFLARNKP